MRKGYRIPVISLLALVAGEPLHAQSTGGATAAGATAGQDVPGAGLDDIIVTARRVSENAQSVPVAVSALSGTQIENKSVRDLKDMGQSVPNLFIRDGPQNPNSAFIVIRGQAQPDQPITIDSTVGLYIDGVNYPHAFGVRANIVDIERIEVLRGPQGTLYGKNTTGGAFSVITRNPTDEFGASVKASVGNYDSYGGNAVLNAPLAEGAALRVVGAFSERDKGFGRDGAGRPLGKESARFVRGKLKLDPTDTLSIVVSGDFQKYRHSGSILQMSGPLGGAGVLAYGLEKGLLTFADTGLIPGRPANGAKIAAAGAAANADAGGHGRYDSSGTTPQGTTFRGYGGSLDLNWDISDEAALRSISSYRNYRTHSRQDLDGTSATLLDSVGDTPRDRNITQEFQLLGHYDTFNYVFGLYAADESGDDNAEAIALKALTNSVAVTEARVSNKNIGAFVQGSWHFVPDWSLTGGFRYTSERKGIVSRNRSRSLITGAETTVIPVALQDDPSQCTTSASVAARRCSASRVNTFSKPSWLVSIDHNFTRDVMAYGKVSHSFRGGGQNLRGSGLVDSFAPFKPEVVTEYEVGFKSEFLDRRVRLNGALFTNSVSNLQKSVIILTPSGATATVLTNAAKARLRGGELETVVRATDIITFNGSLSYTQSKYKRFVDFTGDRSTEPFPTPAWQGSVGVTATVPTAAGTIVANVDYYRQSKLNVTGQAIFDDRVTQKAYGLVNARAALKMPSGVEVAAFVRNLTKTYYFSASVALDRTLGYDIVQRGEPRTFGLDLTMRFGGERR